MSDSFASMGHAMCCVLLNKVGLGMMKGLAAKAIAGLNDAWPHLDEDTRYVLVRDTIRAMAGGDIDPDAYPDWRGFAESKFPELSTETQDRLLRHIWRKGMPWPLKHWPAVGKCRKCGSTDLAPDKACLFDDYIDRRGNSYLCNVCRNNTEDDHGQGNRDG